MISNHARWIVSHANISFRMTSIIALSSGALIADGNRLHGRVHNL